MLPLRKEFIINLKLHNDRYTLKFLEATAEESYYFYANIKTYTDFIAWLPGFIDGLDSLAKAQKKKLIKSAYGDPQSAIQWLYNQISKTRFRTYETRYKDVKNRPKPKKGGRIQSCEAATELNVAQATMIPINMLNKELTLYQRGRIEDGILCNNLNMSEEWQRINRRVWRDKPKQENIEIRKEQKSKINDLEERMKHLHAKLKKG